VSQAANTEAIGASSDAAKQKSSQWIPALRRWFLSKRLFLRYALPMELTAYGIIEFDSDGLPRAVIGFLDTEDSQAWFSAADKARISSRFYSRPPYPKIEIHPAPLNDSSQRNHDRAADLLSEDGKPLWIFPSKSDARPN
jgi:hypothetical protein